MDGYYTKQLTIDVETQEEETKIERKDTTLPSNIMQMYIIVMHLLRKAYYEVYYRTLVKDFYLFLRHALQLTICCFLKMFPYLGLHPYIS